MMLTSVAMSMISNLHSYELGSNLRELGRPIGVDGVPRMPRSRNVVAEEGRHEGEELDEAPMGVACLACNDGCGSGD